MKLKDLINTYGDYEVKQSFIDSYDGLLHIYCDDPKPRLNKEERDYLSKVIKPFKDSINYIVKDYYRDFEYISIDYVGIDNEVSELMMPYFKKGTMYKEMILQKEYKLEDLDL